MLRYGEDTSAVQKGESEKRREMGFPSRRVDCMTLFILSRKERPISIIWCEWEKSHPVVNLGRRL
jgi:hypothetical protein